MAKLNAKIAMTQVSAILKGNIVTALFFRIFIVLLSTYPIASLSLELKGVGRRVPAQIFIEWGKQFSAENPDTTIKYQVGNANEGIKQVELGTVDFGDTDTPLTKAELDTKGLAQFPYMFTAITPVINVPNIFNGQLKLDGKALGDIFLGKITKWNDAAIVATNPRLQLPNEKILVVHGTEGASGTYSMNAYLSKVNSEWKAKTGNGAVINWPVGTAMDSLFSMGQYVKKTPYSIGYSEISYARKNEIIYVQLKNSNGNFVSPHTGSVEKALSNVTWKPDNGFCEDITDEKGADSWPISSASYIVIKKTSDNIERRLTLLNFLGWGIRLGDMIVTDLDFMPIQRTVLPQIRSTWNDTPLSLEGAEVVNAKQVLDLRTNGVPIIDARVAAEYEEAHIPKAISVPYAEKSAKSSNFNSSVDRFDFSKLPENKNAGIVFYCNAGACWKGYKAAAVSVKAGYKKVYWFRGGLPEWQSKNYPVESSGSSHKQ
jgi:phosphate transport system substrate-binding protein